MSFADVLAKTTIDPSFDAVSPGEVASIRADMQAIYNTPTGQTMIDDWLVTAGHTISISYVPGVYQGYLDAGNVELDPELIKNLSYISDHGAAVVHTQLGALAHELGHALTGNADVHSILGVPITLPFIPPALSEFFSDFEGDNVRFVNQIWKELGLPLEVSYRAQSWDMSQPLPFVAPPNGPAIHGKSDLHISGYQYTGGAEIDGAMTRDGDLSTGSTNDLLIGGPSANKLLSGGGNDFLVGAGGDDYLNGGSNLLSNDHDTAVYFAKPTDYDIRLNSDGSWTVRDARGPEHEGKDTLKNVESLQFGSEHYDLKKGGLTFETDFALVIDTTGSMGSSIGSVKASASSLIDALFAGGHVDARVGVVGFKDTTNGEPSSIILPFTDQDDFAARKAAALTAINGISVGGGGDLPETDFDGLLHALNGDMGEWRAGAAVHRVALFTDAPAKDGALAAQVNALAHDIGVKTIEAHASVVGSGGSLDTFELTFASGGFSAAGLNTEDLGPLPFDPAADVPIIPDTTTATLEIYTIFTGPTGTDTSALSSIASSTGGSFLTAPTPDDLVKTLLAIINLPTDSNIGTPGPDTLIGGPGDDLMDGLGGDDIIVGAGGNDTIFGGGGNDAIAGNGGNDIIVGQSGNDIIGGDDGDDRINGGDGNDTIFGGNGNDELGGGAGDDIIVGNDGNDVLFGEAGNDKMNGGAGADILIGGDGNDELGGGAGDDDLNGGAGNDSLFGEDGNDTLNGSTGNDVLLGMGGSDTFAFTAGDGADTIVDFAHGADHIWFYGTNLHSFADVQSHAVFNAATNTTTISYNGGVVTLNGAALNTLTAGDFIFT